MPTDINALVNKHKNAIFNILIILFALYIAMIVFKKQNQEAAGLEYNKDTELSKNAVLENLQQVQAKLQDYSNYVNKKDVNMAMNNLTTLAQLSKIKIISIRPLSERGTALIKEYPFSLRVEAESYHQLGRFFGSLESHPDIYNVQNVRIAPAAGEASKEGQIKVSADLEVSTFLLK